MDKEGGRILTAGLLNGFAGKTELNEIVQDGFSFTTSSYVGPEGEYVDRWTGAGGQEVARAKNGKMYTRLYGGGTLDIDKLNALGLSEKDIIGPNGVLVYFLKKLGDLTRLTEDMTMSDGKFTYNYNITDEELGGRVLQAKEWIGYDKETTIFVHYFILALIK
jgi:hypothetical protein